MGKEISPGYIFVYTCIHILKVNKAQHPSIKYMCTLVIKAMACKGALPGEAAWQHVLRWGSRTMDPASIITHTDGTAVNGGRWDLECHPDGGAPPLPHTWKEAAALPRLPQLRAGISQCNH